MRWSDKLCRFRNIRGCVSTSRGSRYSRVRERSIVHRHKSITQTTINQYCSLTLLSATAGGTWDGTDSNNSLAGVPREVSADKFSYCIAVWHRYYNDHYKIRNQMHCDSLKCFKWICFFIDWLEVYTGKLWLECWCCVSAYKSEPILRYRLINQGAART